MSVDHRTARCLVCGPRQEHRPRLGGLLRRCEACGFSWTAQEQAGVDGLYDEDYFAAGGYDDYFRAEPRRFEANRRLRWLLSTVRPGVLLEAGPAGGYFLEAAQQAGITASGIEVSHAAARFARDHLHVPVRQGHFEDIAPTLTADVVCAFHVLEHVEDPRAFLHAAHDALTPGGWLALEVPNIASAAAQRLGTAWPGLQPRYHRWHFTPDTLVRLVTDAGFEVVQQDTTVFRYYMPLRYRLRHARHLLPADLIGLRSPRLTHPRLGDLLRVIARTPRTRRST
ncbi:class I SAM-dependent methyltransferase [Micromonospora sp. LAH09]|uniref:class I SAM-dependent methyltransferase n=1 Tax=Micromonospora cabrerizensis TaxID=2911213 RepID=UPI001EE95AF4|nr:class I SAM-dependent methyltransferase [Micromonospora cabrerizensis]MCG5468183.1 class I SAM-dependent methyltransferase [Micromonospora cabrerizensis]